MAAFTAAALSYLDRNALAVLAPSVLRDLSITAGQYGDVLSAFSIAYVVANPVWGRAIDRIGARVAFASAVILWSVASGLHGAVTALGGLFVARLLLGFGQGATFPGGVRVMASVAPARLRGISIGFSYLGAAAGACLAPLLAIVAGRTGWRTAFALTGLLVIPWLVFWFFGNRREGDQGAFEDQSQQTYRVHDLLRLRPVQAYITIYALGGYPLAFVLSLAPLYLSRRLGVPQAMIGQVWWAPPVGWGMGFIFWGWLYDRIGGNIEKSRACSMIFSIALVLSAAIVFVPYTASFELVLVIFFISLFATPAFVVPALAWITELMPRGSVGFVTGIGAGAWAAFVAVAMPVMGRLFDARRYNLAFAAVGLLVALGVGAWTALIHRESVAKADSRF